MSVHLSRTAVLVFLLTAFCISDAYRHIPHKRTQIVSIHSNTRLYSDSSGDTGDALSRRRKRRGKEDITVKETAKTEVSCTVATIYDLPTTDKLTPHTFFFCPDSYCIVCSSNKIETGNIYTLFWNERGRCGRY